MVLGLVEVRQGDGNYLRSTESEFLPRAIEWGLLLGSKTTSDLIEARRILEAAIVAAAASRIDAEGLARLEASMELMRRARDTGAFVTADMAFHLGIAEATRNETLTKIMRNMLSLLKVWGSRVMDAESDYGAIIDQHAAILDALARHEPAAAAAAMNAHLADVYRRLEQTLPGKTA